MTLPAGTRLGPYEIVALIGAGGMGAVYRARDSRLGRDVAVKVLPAEFSADADRLRRFEQEARAASALNHPNILTIFDVGEERRSPYVVSELLEGETLRQRLSVAALPARKAVDYALQLARGLSAAHEKGIVHRDLKPENLFLTKDGRVKILDFGLAKLAVPKVSRGEKTDAPTVPMDTGSGVVLGTVGYMSPEQVRGQAADHRSDVFSFGSILYEMLAGRRAFRAESAVETMSAILKEDPPDLSETSRLLPPGLERVVRHCLEKNREERFQSASDLAFALEAISGLSVPSGTVPAVRARPRLMPWLVRTGVLAAVAALAFWLGRGGGAVSPEFRRLTFGRGEIGSARFAPDGQTIVFSAAWQGRPRELFTARPDGPESRALGLASADILAISSAGEMAVGLGEEGSATLARVPLAGGAPRDVLEAVRWADWSPDGKELAVVRRSGGKERLEFPVGKPLFETAGWITHVRVAPDGRSVAFLEHPVLSDDRGRACLVTLEGNKKELSREWRSLWGLAWAPGGREVWFTATQSGARAVYAADLSGRERSILRAPGRVTLEDIARDGRLLLTRDSVRVEMMGRLPQDASDRELSWLDWSLVRDLSADGKVILFDEGGEGGGERYSIYLRRLADASAVRLGEGSGMGLSPDGAWALARVGLAPSELVLLPTGAGETRRLSGRGLSHQRAAWMPDGRQVVFSASDDQRRSRVYVQAIDGDPRPISPEGYAMFWNAASPDGRAVAARDPEGRLVLLPVDGGPPRPVATLLAGETPVGWGLDGGSLFLFRGRALPAEISRLDLKSAGRTRVTLLSPADPTGVGTVSAARVTPDGASFVYSYRRVLSDLYVVEGLR